MRTASQRSQLGSTNGVGSNRLLDALPADQRRRLTRSLRPVFLDTGTVLIEEDAAVESVDFPRSCVVSLASPFDDGSLVEVAMIGNEGIAGVPLVRNGSLAMRAICSVSGWADRMDAATFLSESRSDDFVGELFSDYIRALFGQIAQAAACNRLHSDQERLARWLVMCQDRVGSDSFAITHELLGRLLGARPATMALSAEVLQKAGLIGNERGRVTIIDRDGVESVACECYRSINRALDGVIQRAMLRSRTATGSVRG